MNKLQYIARNIAACLCLLPMLLACSEDKGNYTYQEKTLITIEGIPEQNDYLSGVDYIDLKPVITSNIEGNIAGDNPNFEFLYQKKDLKDNNWKDICQEKDLHMLMNFASGPHICRYIVTDKRTGVQTLQLFYVNSQTITSEGWMVLCNEGEEERVRLDMLSQISARIIPTHDIALKEENVPEMYHATQLGYFNSNWDGNVIALLSKTDAYTIATTDKKGRNEFVPIQDIHKLTNAYFLSAVSDPIVCLSSVVGTGNARRPDAAICISDKGNAYAWNTSMQYTGFESPINTSIRDGKVEFHVAPFIGSSTLRPTGQAVAVALLYDIDNYRFIGWVGDSEPNKQVCKPLKDPANKLFSFNTGGMQLVCMLNVPTSNGTTYCIMQDGSQRHLYCINVSTQEFTQERCCKNIQAPDFDKATCFAANLYPVIYYGYRNKVYAYNYATEESKEIITLDANEEVTMLKFNRFDYPPGIDGFNSRGSEMKAIYKEREKELIVGSYNNAATDNNGGTLSFYKVDDSSSGMTVTLKKDVDEDGAERIWKYGGYAKIKDVRYKEPQ